jgi:hypothetical protein
MIAADSLVMKLLLTAVAAWLSATSDLPASFERPRVALVPPAQIAALRYPTVNPAFRPNVLAVYDDASRTVYLHDAWTGRSLADLSVLVHEMVHHLQNRGGLKYGCPRARGAGLRSAAAVPARVRAQRGRRVPSRPDGAQADDELPVPLREVMKTVKGVTNGSALVR